MMHIILTTLPFLLHIEKFHVTFTTLLPVSINFCIMQEPVK